MRNPTLLVFQACMAVIPRDKPAAKGKFEGKIKHFVIKVNMSIWCARNTSNHNNDSDQLYLTRVIRDNTSTE